MIFYPIFAVVLIENKGKILRLTLVLKGLLLLCYSDYYNTFKKLTCLFFYSFKNCLPLTPQTGRVFATKSKLYAWLLCREVVFVKA